MKLAIAAIRMDFLFFCFNHNITPAEARIRIMNVKKIPNKPR